MISFVLVAVATLVASQSFTPSPVGTIGFVYSATGWQDCACIDWPATLGTCNPIDYTTCQNAPTSLGTVPDASSWLLDFIPSVPSGCVTNGNFNAYNLGSGRNSTNTQTICEFVAPTTTTTTTTPLPPGAPLPPGWLSAKAAGDPHIKRTDGVVFDIDAVGTYDLIRVPFDSGNDFMLKSTVGKEHPESTAMYNRAAEFSGSWMGGHNFTVVGQQATHGAGMYIDNEFQDFDGLCKGGLYQRTLSTNAEVHAAICHFGESSDFCKSQSHRIPAKKRKAGLNSRTIFVSITTPHLNAVVHAYPHHGNLDIHVDTKAGAPLENVGGLLIPQTGRGVLFPLEASSIDDQSDLTSINADISE